MSKREAHQTVETVAVGWNSCHIFVGNTQPPVLKVLDKMASQVLQVLDKTTFPLLQVVRERTTPTVLKVLHSILTCLFCITQPPNA